MKERYIEQIYAGWLAKIIGIRIGAPVEGWTSEKIARTFGELQGYAVDYSRFAADDDSNGPLFFLRAIEDSGKGAAVTSEDVAEALLNYAPYEHGFFWWGGYGCSTEHTAYLNLQAGIPAPRSGSIEQNGRAVAEQIGGQIFIDGWGLVAPGNPELAAKLAREAAGVTHGGDGVHGGIFVAVCISAAFEEKEIVRILETGLRFLPAESGYARIVRTVMDFYAAHPQEPQACLRFIQENYGYDKYPGNCHIIPNTAVMILALLYGNGDFARTLDLCNRCGWDTDCNVGNIATIMGVRGGLAAIPERLRRPVNDFLACSSVVGSLNNQDITGGALYIARQAYALAGEEMPQPWKELAAAEGEWLHFEFQGSTQAVEARVGEREAQGDAPCRRTQETTIRNTEEAAHTGKRSLRVSARGVQQGERAYIFRRTYLGPEDFHDSRYDPAFSPLLYPGQTVRAAVMLPDDGVPVMAAAYAREARSGRICAGEPVRLEKGVWTELSYQIPAIEGALLDEAGVVLTAAAENSGLCDLAVLVDDLMLGGKFSYVIDFSKENIECWPSGHKEVSQFTRWKGQLCLEDGRLLLSGADCAEGYTGRHDWTNYRCSAQLTPVIGEGHFLLAAVQGACRSILAGFGPEETFALWEKTRRGLRLLAKTDFSWQAGETYEITVTVKEKSVSARAEKAGERAHQTTQEQALCAETKLTQAQSSSEAVALPEVTLAYELRGGVGLATRGGSRLYCEKMEIQSL